jgi:hypothetical protein
VFISSGKPEEVRQKHYYCNYYDSHMKSPRFEPQAHPYISIVELPELCQGDVTDMVLKLYTVLFHIDVPLSFIFVVSKCRFCDRNKTLVGDMLMIPMCNYVIMYKV